MLYNSSVVFAELLVPASVYIRILVATFLWGTAFPVNKLCLEYVPPLTLAGLRFSLAGVLLLFASTITDRNIGSQCTRKPQWNRVVLIGFMSTCMFYGLFFLGINLTSASSGAAVDSAGPVISALMAHFVLHKDRLTPGRLIAIGLAVVGVTIVALSRSGAQVQPVNPAGCALILAGLVFSGAGTMLVITYRGGLSLFKLTGCQMCIGGGLLLLISRFIEGFELPPGAMSLRFLLMLLWLASVSAIAFRIWYGLVREYKVTSLSVFSFLTGVWGVVLSIIVLKDPVTIQLVVGMSCVACGVLLMNTIGGNHIREVKG